MPVHTRAKARVRRAAGRHLRARSRQHRLRPVAAAHVPDGPGARVVRAHRAGAGHAIYGAPVVRIDQLGTYNCREMAAFPGWVSEHSYANAIDLVALHAPQRRDHRRAARLRQGRGRRPRARPGMLPAHVSAARVRRGRVLARAHAVLRCRPPQPLLTWTSPATAALRPCGPTRSAGAGCSEVQRHPAGEQAAAGRVRRLALRVA